MHPGRINRAVHRSTISRSHIQGRTGTLSGEPDAWSDAKAVLKEEPWNRASSTLSCAATLQHILFMST